MRAITFSPSSYLPHFIVLIVDHLQYILQFGVQYGIFWYKTIDRFPQ